MVSVIDHSRVVPANSVNVMLGMDLTSSSWRSSSSSRMTDGDSGFDNGTDIRTNTSVSFINRIRDPVTIGNSVVTISSGNRGNNTDSDSISDSGSNRAIEQTAGENNTTSLFISDLRSSFQDSTRTELLTMVPANSLRRRCNSADSLSRAQSPDFSIVDELYEAIMTQDNSAVSSIIEQDDIEAGDLLLANITPVTLCVLCANWRNQSQSADVLRTLLQNGCDVDVREKRTVARRTPLLMACRKALLPLIGKIHCALHP